MFLMNNFLLSISETDTYLTRFMGFSRLVRFGEIDLNFVVFIFKILSNLMNLVRFFLKSIGVFLTVENYSFLVDLMFLAGD